MAELLFKIMVKKLNNLVYFVMGDFLVYNLSNCKTNIYQ